MYKSKSKQYGLHLLRVISQELDPILRNGTLTFLIQELFPGFASNIKQIQGN